LSEAWKFWQENARDSGFSSGGVSRLPGAQGWSPVSAVPSGGSGAAGRLPLCGSADRAIFRRPRFGFPEADSIFKRSETMKRAISYQWYLFFVRAAAIAVLLVALPLSAARAGNEAARVVKYSKEDIVPIRAKLRFSTLIVLPDDEEILDFTTGDKEFWIINGAHNLCYVHPAQAGIRSNLNLITASGHVYSFLLTEISNQLNVEPDLKIFVEPKESSGFAAKTGLAGYVSAGEAEAYKKELAALRTQTADEIHAAEARAAEEGSRFRAGYAAKLVFDYLFDRKAAREPFLVSAIYHDDRFTYIRSAAREKPALYETKDGKPNLISFQLENGVYIAPKIIDAGYLAVGKRKFTFTRRAAAN
jgi:type IV secretion system protein VirB9